jgi:hypothetical protein
MKVCPIQRYGLDRVTAHFVGTGAILGKGSDELEGFMWIDGRRYGPGEKPRITKEFLKPMNLDFDPARKEPPALTSPRVPAADEDLSLV